METGTSFDGDECQACSLSLLASIKDVRYMQRAIPGFRKRLVAVGELGEGVVQPTPGRAQSHLSWWIPDGATVHHRFKIIDLAEVQS